jgi:hypothetical protein
MTTYVNLIPYLFNDIALPHRCEIWAVKGADYLPTSHGSETFNAIEIGVFDGHHTIFRKDGFRKVVNELPVDEHITSVCNDFFTLLTHPRLQVLEQNEVAGS